MSSLVSCTHKTYGEMKESEREREREGECERVTRWGKRE